MQVHKTLAAPSTVTHAISCRFTGEDNLFVVRGSSILQLYKTVSVHVDPTISSIAAEVDLTGTEDLEASGAIIKASSSSAETEKEKEKRLEAEASAEDAFLMNQDTFIGSETALIDTESNLIPTLDASQPGQKGEWTNKLVLVQEWPLQGQVIGLNKIQTSSTPKGCDSLLVAFKYAKISLVAWDAPTHSIVIHSLHYYEKSLFDTLFVDSMFQAKFDVDPNNKAATLLFQHDTLAFLPFVQDELLDEAIINTATNGANSQQNGSGPAEKVLAPIYKPSFILSGHMLNESIENILDFAYLPSYREPTIAVLYQPTRTWASRIQLEKDTVCYLVLSIDFTQRTFTSIVSAKNLPYTLSKIVPLKEPLGGSLLVGSNEVIHIDSQGRVNGVSVNPLHGISSSLELRDQKDLDVTLDGCVVTQLDDAPDEALVVLQTGKFLSLKFHIESRKVQEIAVKKISTKRELGLPMPTVITNLGSRYILVGSATSDSKLVQWKREGEAISEAVKEDPVEDVPEPHSEDPASKKTKDEDGDDNMYDELDDIYGQVDTTSLKTQSKVKIRTAKVVDNRPIVVRLSDRLRNYGPINDMVVCQSKGADADDGDYYDVVASTGSGVDGHLTVFNRKLRPSVVSKLKLKNNFSRIWALSPSLIPSVPSGNKSSTGNGIDTDVTDGMVGSNFDTYLIGSNSKGTFIFKIGEEFEDVTSSIPKFKYNAQTLAATTILNGRIVVQVCPTSIVIYDSDMSYLTKQNIPEEPKLVSFANDLIILNYENKSEDGIKTEDQNIKTEEGVKIKKEEEESKRTIIYQIQEKSNGWAISEKSHPSQLPSPVALFGGSSNILANAIPESTTNLKRKRGEEPQSASIKQSGPASITYSLSESSLHISFASNSSSALNLTNLLHLPNVLRLKGTTFVEDESLITSSQQVNKTEITQISHFVLENSIEKGKECLAILTSSNEVHVYQFIRRSNRNIMLVKFTDSLSLSLLNKNQQYEEKQEDFSDIPTKLIPYENIGEFSGLFVLGKTPTMILKQASSPVQFHSLASSFPILGFTSFNTPSVNKGFAYIDAEYMLRISTLPEDTDFGTAWPTHKIYLDARENSDEDVEDSEKPIETVISMSYHETGDVLAVATAYPESGGYEANDPEGNPIPDLNLEMPRPDAYRSKLKLISLLTWTVIDQVEYGVNESVVTLKSVMLEVSEKTKQQKEFLVVGTSIIRGEDLAAMGGFYIYEAIDVVPEPGRPETNRKLKQVTSEVGKGAVTSVCEVSGHLLIAQAQKVVVRNIQEDLSIVPVAFMDMNMYVLSSKSLKYMVLLADAIRSVWLVGFGQEPYRMTLFGKDYRDVQVTSCDFAVVQKKLYIVVADAQQRIHILQYDPEDPMPFSGQRLIRRAEFFTGKDIDSMVMLQYDDPVSRSKEEKTEGAPKQGVFVSLCGARDGSLSVIVPVPEATYRPLYVVQQQLADKEEHYLGLNPRMHRATGVAPPATTAQGKAIIDFDLVRTFQDLSVERRAQYARRLGKTGEINVWKSMVYVNDALRYL